jgi:hypothetical protein
MTGLKGRASSRWAERRACNVLQSLTETRLRSTVLQPRFDVSLVVCEIASMAGETVGTKERSLTQRKSPRWALVRVRERILSTTAAMCASSHLYPGNGTWDAPASCSFSLKSSLPINRDMERASNSFPFSKLWWDLVKLLGETAGRS